MSQKLFLFVRMANKYGRVFTHLEFSTNIIAGPDHTILPHQDHSNEILPHTAFASYKSYTILPSKFLLIWNTVVSKCGL